MVASKLPPHDVSAEEAVIAALLVEPGAAGRIATIVKADDFFRDKNRWVFEACLALWQRGETPNAVLVAHELLRAGKLEEAGGSAFLSRIVTELPTTVGIEHYAETVRRDAVYRRLIGAAAQITQQAYVGGPDLSGALDRAEALVAALRSTERSRRFLSFQELLERYWEDVLSGNGTGPQALRRNVRTGFVDLDTLLGGMKASDLIVLAARPSLGKTALALKIARNAAVAQGTRVAIFSLEMSAEQLARRVLTSEARVDGTRLRLGEHTEDEERRVMHALGLLSGLPVYVDDSPSLSTGEMRAKASALKETAGVDLVIVDYLQMMRASGRRQARVEEVTQISRSLKELARELEVPVLADVRLHRPARAPLHRPPGGTRRQVGGRCHAAAQVASRFGLELHCVGRESKNTRLSRQVVQERKRRLPPSRVVPKHAAVFRIRPDLSHRGGYGLTGTKSFRHKAMKQAFRRAVCVGRGN